MKPTLTLVLLALANVVSGQTEVTSKPSGCELITLTAKKTNLIGLRFQRPSVAAGTLDAVGTSSVTDNDASFSLLLETSKLYILELTSGTLAGLTVEATWSSGHVLSIPDDLASSGVTTGTTYNLRPAATLEEIFGTEDSILTKSNSKSKADIVWLPDGDGSYTKYYLDADSQWRRLTKPAGIVSNVPVIYTDGLYVQKRSAAAVLPVAGEVKTTTSITPVIKGVNLLSSIYPSGATLQNSGLTNYLKIGAKAAKADLVWIPNGTGGYIKYFLNSSSTWQRITSPAGVVLTDIELTPGVVIQRRGAAANFTLTPPDSYDDL